MSAGAAAAARTGEACADEGGSGTSSGLGGSCASGAASRKPKRTKLQSERITIGTVHPMTCYPALDPLQGWRARTARISLSGPG